MAGAVVGAVVSGVFGGGGTPQISGSPKEAVAVVEAYSAALGRHDWTTICNRLYSTSARATAGGANCALQLEQNAGNVTEPKLRIVSIDVHGDRATVQVQASVNGGPALQNTIELVRERGAYRLLDAGGTGD